TLSMEAIVVKQNATIWNVVPQFPAFVAFLIAGLAETNRPPFDLPEAESELVAGFHTEYSGIKFAMFYLAEYVHTVTISAVAVTLFLGGWAGPGFAWLPWLWPLLWFFAKLSLVIYFFIWIRATLPRMRYDRLMHFGWKVLIPFGLVWVLLTALGILMRDELGTRGAFFWLAIIAGIAFMASLLWPVRAKTEPETPSATPEGVSP
ncbi:MAG: complex I subunit 1 family protein, partial [Actinomycetota bacterium]